MADVDITDTTRGGDGVRCYLAGILFPIIFLTRDPYKTNRFIRFHSFQSIVFTLMWAAVIGALRLLHEQSAVATVLSIAWIVFFTTWVLLMVKAYQGRMFKLPLVGLFASRWAG